jgi:hypothetical protein
MMRYWVLACGCALVLSGLTSVPGRADGPLFFQECCKPCRPACTSCYSEPWYPTCHSGPIRRLLGICPPRVPVPCCQPCSPPAPRCAPAVLPPIVVPAPPTPRCPAVAPAPNVQGNEAPFNPAPAPPAPPLTGSSYRPLRPVAPVPPSTLTPSLPPAPVRLDRIVSEQNDPGRQPVEARPAIMTLKPESR